MLYGVETQFASEGPLATPVPGLSFPNTGPNFQSALSLSSLTSAVNTGVFSWAGWFKQASWDSGGFRCAWMIDPNNEAATFVSHVAGVTWETWQIGPSGEQLLDIDAHNNGNPNSLGTFNGQWVHCMSAFDLTNHVYGFKINGAASNIVTFTNTGTGPITAQAKKFYLGDDGFGDTFAGSIFDLSIWPNVNFMSGGPEDIQLATIRLFINASNQPVRPSVAIAALGSPAIMATGGLAGFMANSHGTAGPLTVPTTYGDGSSTTYDLPVEVAGLSYGTP